MAKKAARISNHKIGALIRKHAEIYRQEYAEKFKIGEFVKEKYRKDTYGLILQDVETKKMYLRTPASYLEGTPSQIAERYYRYTVTVLWMHHPDVIAGEMDQITNMNVNQLVVKKEKKVLETAKDL